MLYDRGRERVCVCEWGGGGGIQEIEMNERGGV